VPDETGWSVSGDPAQALFRQALGRFPTGVTLVSTLDDGAPMVMTASSFTSVSLDPLLVLVCVAHSTRFHPAVLRSREWGVSFLAAHQAELSNRFAAHGRDLDASLEDVEHHPGRVLGVPLLDGALATLECRTTAAYSEGDHTIVVGRVLDVVLGSDPSPALVFHRGGYQELEVLEPPVEGQRG
jgi:flavin reductase (DIM6/NTAB) family NADH-FMN oxidoreductase RutF